MARKFDNIDQDLLTALRATMQVSKRAVFCVGYLYGLTEVEFAHILGTFPLVAEPVKVAALNAWRNVEGGLIQ